MAEIHIEENKNLSKEKIEPVIEKIQSNEQKSPNTAPIQAEPINSEKIKPEQKKTEYLQNTDKTLKIIGNLQNLIETQGRQITALKFELESTRKEFEKLHNFPKSQLALLRKYNGRINEKYCICFVFYQGNLFGIMSRQFANRFSENAEAELKVQYEDCLIKIEVKGRVHFTHSEIAILKVNLASASKEIQDHCLPLDEIHIKPHIEIGTKIVCNCPSANIETGYITSSKLKENGELLCQIKTTKEFTGSFIFDESSLPTGICIDPIDILKNHYPENNSLESKHVLSMFPLAVELLISPPICRIIHISKILEELDLVVKLRKEEEQRKFELQENRIFLGVYLSH